MRIRKESLIDDIYMLTNTDSDIVDESMVFEYLRKKIINKCEKYRGVMGDDLYNRYISAIYDTLTNRQLKLEKRQEIYDAMANGQMIGGLVL